MGSQAHQTAPSDYLSQFTTTPFTSDRRPSSPNARVVKHAYQRNRLADARRLRPHSGRNSPARESSRPSSACSSADSAEADCAGDAFAEWTAAFHPTVQAPDASSCLTPPITAATLGELEVAHVVSNSRLRHDVNFDRELHFRPNLDGSRGQEKLQRAAKYWTSLQWELEAYGFLLAHPGGAEFRWGERWSKFWKSHQQRVPVVFTAIRDILISLMPERDQAKVHGLLDISLVLQQIEHGVFDMGSFACTLAKLLKAHCAPMRDPWVDRMAEQLAKGGATFDAREIVDGLKELFGVLEAMKLDIANHQIRHLHPMLVENTIPFERIYQRNKIYNGQVNVGAAVAWYRSAAEYRAHAPSLPELPTTSSAELELADFTTVIVSSLFPHLAEYLRPIPDTFKLDQERLYNICSDVLYAINMESCGAILKHVMGKLGRSHHETTAACAELSNVIGALVGQRANEAAWDAQRPNIAAEIVRLAGGPVCSKQQDRTRLLEYVDLAEALLGRCFNLQAASGYEPAAKAQESVRNTLLAKVWNSVRENAEHSPAGLFESLVSSPVKAKPNGSYYASSKPAAQRVMATSANTLVDLDDLVRRITHISLLHWKVWRPLVYVREDQGVVETLTPPASP